MDVPDMHAAGVRPPTPPPSSPEAPPRLKSQAPRPPFFALFQTHFICSCACTHISKGEKVSLRLMASKTAEDNIVLMRHLLRLEKADTLTFEDEEGNPAMPDYNGLKDNDRNKVKIIVFIKRNDGELIERLANENVRRKFRIYRDVAVRGWVVGKEDRNMKEQCPCDGCMLLREHDAYIEHLEERAGENGWEISSNLPTNWDEEDDDVSLMRAETSPVNAPQVNTSNDPYEVAFPHHFNDHGIASVEDEYHYGRIIPGAGSVGVPKRKKKLESQKIVPTDQEYRLAASILRRMR